MRSNRNDNSKANKVTSTLFIIYLIALCWIIILKLGVQFSYMNDRSVNLNPFSEPLIFNGEFIMNVVIFVPLGIYTGVLFTSWTFGKKLFFYFCISLLLEVLQFILKIGAFDVADIIANTSGGILGLILLKAIEAIFKSNIKAQKIVNLISAIATVVILSLLVLLKMDMLPIRYK